jgi:nitroimidazol reductase NimA-like FMN-containing flavoprotein (pyridoxamine 5'-phosphate oxidase superfamily)
MSLRKPMQHNITGVTMSTSTSMTIEQREQFLTDLRVGVLSIEQSGRGPLTAPIWYGYEAGGDLWFLIGPDSRKARALEQVERINLCVQCEQPPYRYVSVEGPVIAQECSDTELHSRPLVQRYLGVAQGDAYVASTAEQANSLLIRMRPERWLTVDYGKIALG